MSRAHDHMAERQGARHELELSRRSSDAVRARAAELDRSPKRFLEQVITAGLAALADLPPPMQADFQRPEEKR